MNAAKPNAYFWFPSRCLANELARCLAYARPLKSAISQNVDWSLSTRSVLERERAHRSLAPPRCECFLLRDWPPPPPRHPASCAVRRPGRGLSTVCPLCVRSTPVVSHRHNCIPRPEREEREERSQVKVFTFHSPNFLRGFFATLCSARSTERSRNIAKFGKLWSPFMWPMLGIFTFFFRTFPLQIPRLLRLLWLLRLLRALCHLEHLLLSSRQ